MNALAGDVQTAVFNWRFIHDKEIERPAIKRRGTLSAIWNEACNFNANGYGIFATVNEMDGFGYGVDGRPLQNGVKTDTLEHVASIRAHVVDLDNLNAPQNLQHALQHPMPPQFYVQTSPNKFHVYWTVTPYRDNEWFKTVQRQLRQFYDGDKAVVDATRVLRVPGFYHRKGAPHLVTCYQAPGYGHRCDPGQLAATLAHITAIDDSTTGTRHKLGDPALAAPSADWLWHALDTMPIDGMSHPEFIAFTAAYKQAGWSVAEPDMLRERWLAWCERFGDASKGRDYNLKHWDSITDTEIGWKGLLRQNPSLNAKFIFQGVQTVSQQPVASAEAQLDFLDHSTTISTAGKPVSFEVYRILNDVKIAVGFDEFKSKVLVRSRLPWERKPAARYPRDWTDTDEEYLRAYLQPQKGMARISMDQVRGGLRMYADRNRFNPVVDWLNDLHWDGLPRLNELFTYYFRAENHAFAKLTGPKFLIGMVARALNPGCKRDEMPIFEGEQGAKKSSALNIIAGDEYFSDGLPNIHDKDAMQHLQGMWLIEIGELSALRKSEVEEVKRFVSSKTDKFRPAYGRNMVAMPRTSVFAGTTNNDAYLKDPTGARRFWPIRCGAIDLDGLRRDREQLFGEAVARYRSGERWWLDGDAEWALASDETNQRQEADPWHDQVMRHVALWEAVGGSITMQSIMEHGLGLSNPNMKDVRATSRIAAVLRIEGYRRKQLKRGGPWLYVKR